nr:uncharacterized mitochondrial protein AtMg00810-like [Tanacetum cinerariifolium]
MPLLKKFALLMKSRYNCGQRRGTPCPVKGVLRIQQYLQNEHYALWEVIEFGDSYEALQEVVDTGSASEGSAKKKGRTVAVTTEDMQKRRNDNTFGGNEATKKTKKNQLKQQYGNFKAKGKEILEQTFNRLQAIVSNLEFMDIKIEQDNLNQKFLTSLAPEWLMYTIVWRNRSDLNTMSLDDLYNHLKVYKPEVKKKPESNSQNMAFISLAKTSSEKEKVNTASFSTASTQVSPANADVATVSFSHDTVCAYIASQSNGSQFKYEDINQIDEDDIEEMDIKWNMALLRWDWSYMANEEENHVLVADEEAPTEFALMAISSSENKVEARLVEFKNQKIKFYEKIRGLEFKVESKANRIERLTKELYELKKEKEGLDSKLTESNSSDLQNSDSSVYEKGDSSKSITSKPMIKFIKATGSPTEVKISKVETVRKPFIKYAKMYRNTIKSPKFDHLAYDCAVWEEQRKTWPKNNNTHKMRTQFRVPRVSTVNPKFLTVNKKFPTGNSKLSIADLGNKGKAGNSQNVIDDKGYWNSGCSRHMTVNVSYLPIMSLMMKVAKASADESVLWHRRLSHLNFKIMNKLVRHNLVRVLPSKCFENDHTCVACLKEKQHKASFKTKFTWTFFLKTKDKTSGILRNFITEIENLKELKAEAVNTACYVQNRVLVNKSQNKTPYELFNGRTPAIGFIKPFECHVMILNTLDNLGKFDAKGDEGTTSTNFSDTKDAASQDVKKDVSSLRYIALPNWFHEAHLESSTSTAQDACNADAPESSGNFNPTATSKHPLADHMETLTVETLIPTVSSPVPTACLDDSLEPSSDTRLISKRVTSQDDTPSLDNILNLSNRFEDILGVTTNSDDTNGVEADLGNMENNISARFTVYQMDVKSAFLYGTINEEVYVMQPLGFQDPEFPARVYKVEKVMYGLHQAPRAWSANTPMEKENPWGKNRTGKDVDLHLYRSMIGSLMYLTASRLDIMFTVCARHQVTPKECYLHAVKRIFRYLKGHPKLGLWYPKESPFDLVAYSDSDYGGATQDRKSTTGGCQFLGRRLISWQCKK